MLKKYLGLIAFAISVVGIIACFLLASDIIPTQNNFALSDFGVDVRTQLVFNGSLILSGILSLLYTFFYFSKYQFRFKKLVLAILLLANISLIGIGLFPYSINYAVHTLSALTYFFSFSIFFIIFGLFFKNEGNFKKLVLTMGFIQLVITILFISLHLSYAIGELIQVVLVGIFYIGLYKTTS